MNRVTTAGKLVHVGDEVKGAIYIGRAVPRRGIAMSAFANPYRIGSNPLLGGQVLDRAGAVEHFRREITTGVLRHLLPKLPELRSRPLACWCRHYGEPARPENAYHADVLLELLSTYSDEELRGMTPRRRN